jgi:nucleoside-diphosphate-sugar epimerase
MRIFLTGATGFIGRSLYLLLKRRNHTVTCAVRKDSSDGQNRNSLFERICYFDTLNVETDFRKALEKSDVVIHLAARAHMLTKSDYDLYDQFMDINFHSTRNLAEQAAQKGVKRFVFISSIGVNGKSTEAELAYTEEDEEKPFNSYTLSKLRAEQALRKIEADTGMEVVIIRPPLVYGPEVKANFLKLLDLVHTGVPLPFAGLKNKRSFIAIDNLVDAITECAVHEKAGGETFLVSDGHPLSTPQLLDKISISMGVHLRMFYFPSPILKAVLTLFQKKGIYERLWENLIVDSTKIQQYLGWLPKVTVDEGIQKTVQWYVENYKRNPAIKTTC